jgi:hypothetical protein
MLIVGGVNGGKLEKEAGVRVVRRTYVV